MIQKILTLARNDLYITFSDRNLILIMLVTPLALATIIGLAFSGITSGGSGGITNIPVAIVNHDQPISFSGQNIAYGDQIEQILVPPADITEEEREENQLWQLLNAVVVEDEATARAGVEDGTYTAAIIIPANLTSQIAPSQNSLDLGNATIELFTSPASPTYASVVKSVMESITTQISTGNITIAAVINALIERATSDIEFGLQFAASSTDGSFQPNFAPAFTPTQQIRINQQTSSGAQSTFNPFIFFGTGQAVFFMMFTAMALSNNILYERKQGTLARLFATPTSRSAILFGKLLGALVTCVVQVLLLLFFLTLINGLLSGSFTLIFGSNFFGLVLVIFSVSIAAVGLGAVISSLSKTPEFGNIVGSLITMAMGIFGGAFFDVSAIGPFSIISRLTINYWGVNAFTRLSQGNNDILLNVGVLLGIGAVLFGIGLFIFNRRLEV